MCWPESRCRGCDQRPRLVSGECLQHEWLPALIFPDHGQSNKYAIDRRHATISTDRQSALFLRRFWSFDLPVADWQAAGVGDEQLSRENKSIVQHEMWQ